MIEINPDSEKYHQVLKMQDHLYIFKTDKLEPGESVTCPCDHGLKILKKSDGTIAVQKKSRRNPFHHA